MGLGDPRVIWSLYDLSTYVAQIPQGWQIVLVQTERGPMWTPTPVSDSEYFINTFGDSVLWSYDPLWCIQALDNGANLVVVRIGHCTDITDRTSLTWTSAYCQLADRGGSPTAASVTSDLGPFTFQQAAGGSFLGTEDGPYLIVLDTNDKLSFQLGSATAQEVTLTAGAAITTAAAIIEINAQTDGFTCSVVDNRLYVEATDVSKSITIGAITHDAYSAIGLQEGVYPAVAGTQDLNIKIDGEGTAQSFTLTPEEGETGDFVLTNSQIAEQLSALTPADVSAAQGRLTIASSTVGQLSSVQIVSTSTAAAALGFDNEVYEGWEGTAVMAWQFELDGPGAYGNGAQVYIYDNSLQPGEAIDFRIVVPGGPDIQYTSLTNDPTDPRYWINYINSNCDIGTITQIETPNPSPTDWPAVNTNGIVLAGGSNGVTTLQDNDYIGDAAAKTGLYCTDNTTMPAIDIWCPGTTSATVHNYALQFVSNRCGRFYQGATPPDMSVSETIYYRMGTPPDYTYPAFNDCNGSFIYGEYQVLDTKYNQKRWLPASYQLAAAVTRTDQAYDPAISPFGTKRGRCPGVLAIKNNIMPASAEADLLAEYGLNNARILQTSVETRGQEGALLWGGWTLQRHASALLEFPVVRKIKQYEQMLLPVMLGFINDPNHPVTWGEVQRTLEPVFREDLAKFYIYGYFIQTDATAFFAGGDLKGAVLNTPEAIDRGIYTCRMLIKPLRQIFYFQAQMGIMRTGDPFSTYSTLYSLPGWVRA